jgi:hypothetical protein
VENVVSPSQLSTVALLSMLTKLRRARAARSLMLPLIRELARRRRSGNVFQLH